MIQQFSEYTIEHLKCYVYALFDPREPAAGRKPFYIGKGVGNRCFQHAELEADLADDLLQPMGLSTKLAALRSIRQSALAPDIEIVRHGMSEKEAFAVEAALIEFIGLETLTNVVTGHGATEYGRSPVGSLEAKYGGKDVTITEPSMLFNVSKLFDPKESYTPDEVQQITSEWWKVNPNNANRANLAFAVRNGVVRAVYEIHSWEPPHRGTDAHKKFPTCHRFLGTHVPDSPYMYGKVGHHFHGSSSPFVYINVSGIGKLTAEGE